MPHSFIFLYSPAYNCGYNALTYSKCRSDLGSQCSSGLHSLPCGIVPVPHTFKGYCYLPMVGKSSRFLQSIRQSYWYCQRRCVFHAGFFGCISSLLYQDGSITSVTAYSYSSKWASSTSYSPKRLGGRLKSLHSVSCAAMAF